jgi:hypothetical protein
MIAITTITAPVMIPPTGISITISYKRLQKAETLPTPPTMRILQTRILSHQLTFPCQQPCCGFRGGVSCELHDKSTQRLSIAQVPLREMTPFLREMTLCHKKLSQRSS